MNRLARVWRWYPALGVGLSAMLLSGCATFEKERESGWRMIPLAESRLVAQEPRPTAYLDRIAEEASRKAVEEQGEGQVAPGEIYATVIDCRDPRDPRMGSYHGGESVYPASVVKLCYMVDAFDRNRTGGLALDRAMWKDLRLMIGPSDNQATNRILDRLTGTGFGEELEGRAWDSFAHKRQEVGRYFQEIGLPGLWAANHTFDGNIRLYGRDVQWLGPKTGDHYKQSNSMTTDDTARLLYLIWRQAVVDPEACEDMLGLMGRKPSAKSAFFESIVPKGVGLYSKAGFTDTEHHDAGIFKLGKGKAIIVVVFTINHGAPPGKYLRVVPRAGQTILEKTLAEPGILDGKQGP